ncbi:polyphosphate kinase 2 [Candidatus Gracilibacteria bacterium]|nr:polyphosphate kinase 2 [Candidatus Gracilibacteria bacterium]
MTALFYQIINNIEKITDQNYQDFKNKLLALLREFQEHDDVDNVKVLRNKLHMLLADYLKNKNEHKAIKHHLKDLQKFVHELDDIIEEMDNPEVEDEEKKIKLIDVVKKIEKRYKKYSKYSDKQKESRKKVGIKKKTISYEKELIQLQLELVKLQRYITQAGKKVLIIFEGRDAAGKGGNIKRFTEYLNPRAAKVVALQKPTEVEQTQWYFQRYVKHLPNGGEMAFFDRSWYNRAGVEPVMGFVSKKDYEKFIYDVPRFEEMLIDSGIDVIKLYYSVSKDEQAKRFHERKTNPLKQFKLSPIDQKSQQLWKKYTLAEYQNFSQTSTNKAPWIIIDSNDKKASRINSIKYVLSLFDYPGKIDKKYLKYDTSIVHSAEERVMELKSEIGKNADLFGEK